MRILWLCKRTCPFVHHRFVLNVIQASFGVKMMTNNNALGEGLAPPSLWSTTEQQLFGNIYISNLRSLFRCSNHERERNIKLHINTIVPGIRHLSRPPLLSTEILIWTVKGSRSYHRPSLPPKSLGVLHSLGKVDYWSPGIIQRSGLRDPL